MSMVGTKGTWIAALLLSAGLLGSGGLAASAAPAAQTPPAAQPAANGDRCQTDDDEEDDQEDDGAEDEADDDAEGETQGDTENDDAEGAEDDDGAEDEADDATEDEGTTAKPGELSEGQDLLPTATISVEQAVRAAQGAATGTLGSVELEEKDGTLVFEVTVGDQEVFVDAADGSIASVETVQLGADESDDACDDDAADATPAAGVGATQNR